MGHGLRATTGRLLFCACFTLSPLLASSGPGAANEMETKEVWTCSPHKLEMFSNGWPKVLDVGVYWFGTNGQAERATGGKSQFYDPKKKTIIFIDGWNGLHHVRSCFRMTSQVSPMAKWDCDQYLADPWIAKGWNWGIFFWDQFADEDCVYESERKIWVAPRRGLTWKSHDLSTNKTTREMWHGPEQSVAEICAGTLRSALATFEGASLRFVGFSVGAQLAAACADKIHEQSSTHPAAPTGVVLLDPTFTGAVKPWSFTPIHVCPTSLLEAHHTVQFTSDALKRLWSHDVVTTVVKSSGVSEGNTIASLVFDRARELELLGIMVEFVPDYCGHDQLLKIACRHEAAVPMYFFNVGNEAPTVENVPTYPQAGTCKVPWASCTDDELKEVFKQQQGLQRNGSGQVWRQAAGTKTCAMDDDVYKWETFPLPHPETSRLYLQDLRGQMLWQSVGGFTGLAIVAGVLGSLGAVSLGLITLRRVVHRSYGSLDRTGLQSDYRPEQMGPHVEADASHVNLFLVGPRSVSHDPVDDDAPPWAF